MNKRRVPLETVEEVGRLWRAGAGCREIGRRMGLHPESVRHVLRRRLGIDTNRRNRRTARAWTEAEEADLRRLWLQGARTADIAAELARAAHTVTLHARDMGLPPRARVGRGSAEGERIVVLADRRKRRMRPCLACAKPFPSEGAHERVCPACKRNHAALDGRSHGFAGGGRTIPRKGAAA